MFCLVGGREFLKHINFTPYDVSLVASKVGKYFYLCPFFYPLFLVQAIILKKAEIWMEIGSLPIFLNMLSSISWFDSILMVFVTFNEM